MMNKLIKKITNILSRYYTPADLFSSDKEYRKDVWIRYGKCTGLLLVLVTITMSILHIVDWIGDKIVDKKLKETENQAENEIDFDKLDYRISLRTKEDQITSVIGVIVSIIYSILCLKVINKFWRKK